jgi:H+-transporting ATPase
MATSASDIVLTKEGLSVIVDAIIGSRKIFQRMKVQHHVFCFNSLRSCLTLRRVCACPVCGMAQNYCMYSISVCVRIVLTFGILTLAYDWYAALQVGGRARRRASITR